MDTIICRGCRQPKWPAEYFGSYLRHGNYLCRECFNTRRPSRAGIVAAATELRECQQAADERIEADLDRAFLVTAAPELPQCLWCEPVWSQDGWTHSADCAARSIPLSAPERVLASRNGIG